MGTQRTSDRFRKQQCQKEILICVQSCNSTVCSFKHFFVHACNLTPSDANFSVQIFEFCFELKRLHLLPQNLHFRILLVLGRFILFSS